MKRITIFLIFTFITQILSQDLRIDKIEPPNWWADHTYNNIQLMVYGENLDSAKVEIEGEGVILEKVTSPYNSNYVFLDLQLNGNVKPGKIIIKFSNRYGNKEFEYSLLQRENSAQNHKGFSNKDVVYLVFPDRFVNGDKTNDFLFNDKEEFQFGSLNGRHGGDIQGIINKLDYLKDLGITTIWSTPLTENNMFMSYHGYAATNLYKIDPRHGTNELYKEFVEKAHQKGLKVILDHVANHIGSNHHWINNLPTETWINGSPKNHLPAEHDKVAYVDIYAADNSITNANLGWFVDTMPDLNQTDPFMAQYIIQNTIWWIEYSGIDGIREDTYPYANQKFMSEWAKEILTHYPKFNIVGEVWQGVPSMLAKFQTNSYFPKDFDSNLPVVTDFAFKDVVIDYMSGKSDLHKVYELFGEDFVYSNPNNLLVFFDNHDTDRGMHAANWDLHKYKVALTLTLTTRGIPQLFYGTEIGMDGGGHHGKIRDPFPGGFNDNQLDCFTEEGRNDKQNEIYNFTKILLELRNKYPAISIGELTQFQPKNNIYVYIKNYKDQKILTIINDSDFNQEVYYEDFQINLNNNTKMTSLLDKDYILNSNEPKINQKAKSISIFLID